MRLVHEAIDCGTGGTRGTCRFSPGSRTAPPSYLGVQHSIETIRQSWSAPGARPQPNAAGWNALFDALLGDLDAYSKATSEGDRLDALEHIQQISSELAAVPWSPGHRPARRNPAVDSSAAAPGGGQAPAQGHGRRACRPAPTRTLRQTDRVGWTSRTTNWETRCAIMTRLRPVDTAAGRPPAHSCVARYAGQAESESALVAVARARVGGQRSVSTNRTSMSRPTCRWSRRISMPTWSRRGPFIARDTGRRSPRARRRASDCYPATTGSRFTTSRRW